MISLCRGAVIGDPHFITFDGTMYSFNGWGEFWLLGVDRLQRRDSESFRRDGTILPGGVTWPWKYGTLLPRDRTIRPRDITWPRDVSWPRDVTRPRDVSWPPNFLNTPGPSGESTTRSGHSRNNNPSMEEVEFAMQGRFEPATNETGRFHDIAELKLYC